MSEFYAMVAMVRGFSWEECFHMLSTSATCHFPDRCALTSDFLALCLLALSLCTASREHRVLGPKGTQQPSRACHVGASRAHHAAVSAPGPS